MEEAEPQNTFQHQPLGPDLSNSKVNVVGGKDTYLLLLLEPPHVSITSLLQVSVPAARAAEADTSTSHLVGGIILK